MNLHLINTLQKAMDLPACPTKHATTYIIPIDREKGHSYRIMEYNKRGKKLWMETEVYNFLGLDNPVNYDLFRKEIEGFLQDRISIILSIPFNQIQAEEWGRHIKLAEAITYIDKPWE